MDPITSHAAILNLYRKSISDRGLCGVELHADNAGANVESIGRTVVELS